jgi:hypothetical protein
MGNCIIAAPDAVLTPGVSVSGGSWLPALPASNLLRREFAYLARSTDAAPASTQFMLDLGQTRDVLVIAVPACNGSLSAKIRVRGNNNAAPMDAVPSYALDLTTAATFGAEVVRTALSTPGWGASNAASVSSVKLTAPAAIASGTYTYVLQVIGTNNIGTFGGFVTAGGWGTGTTYINKATGQQTGLTITVVAGGSTWWLNGWVDGGINTFVMSVSPGVVICGLNGGPPQTIAITLPAYPYVNIGGSPWDMDMGLGKPGIMDGAPLYGAIYPVAVSAAEVQRLSVAGADKPVALSSNLPLADTGWRPLYGPIYPIDTLWWGSQYLWDGVSTQEDVAVFPQPWIAVLPQPVVARYWQVEISDPTNAAGYVQLPRIVLAPGWQPTRNMQYGATLGIEDTSQVQTSLGGAEFFDLRAKRRVARFTIGKLPQNEATSQALVMQQRLGISGQVFFVWNPDDTANLGLKSFLGRMRTLSPLEAAAHGRMNAPFEILEVVA